MDAIYGHTFIGRRVPLNRSRATTSATAAGSRAIPTNARSRTDRTIRRPLQGHRTSRTPTTHPSTSATSTNPPGRARRAPRAVSTKRALLGIEVYGYWCPRPAQPLPPKPARCSRSEEDVDGVRCGGVQERRRRCAIWLSAIHGDAPYLVFDDEKYSYSEYATATAIACRLVDDSACQRATVSQSRCATIRGRSVPLGRAPSVQRSCRLERGGQAPSWSTAFVDRARSSFADDERLDRIRPRLGETSVQTVIAVRKWTRRG